MEGTNEDNTPIRDGSDGEGLGTNPDAFLEAVGGLFACLGGNTSALKLKYFNTRRRARSRPEGFLVGPPVGNGIWSSGLLGLSAELFWQDADWIPVGQGTVVSVGGTVGKPWDSLETRCWMPGGGNEPLGGILDASWWGIWD